MNNLDRCGPSPLQHSSSSQKFQIRQRRKGFYTVCTGHLGRLPSSKQMTKVSLWRLSRETPCIYSEHTCQREGYYPEWSLTRGTADLRNSALDSQNLTSTFLHRNSMSSCWIILQPSGDYLQSWRPSAEY